VTERSEGPPEYRTISIPGSRRALVRHQEIHVSWEHEFALSFINDGHFYVTETGPLHAPIKDFSIRRDEKLKLIITTRCPGDAKSSEPDRPAGTVRQNVESAELENIGATKAKLRGLIPYSDRTTHNHRTGDSELTEEALIHEISVPAWDDRESLYTIDWVENLPTRPFAWPASIDTKTEILTTRKIGRGDNVITLFDKQMGQTGSNHAVKIVVEGTDIYVCALDRKDGSELKKPGYSIGGRVLDLPTLPPAPLGGRWQDNIDPFYMARLVNAIFHNYETLDFGNLSWTYWHALCATPHIAAVHFGAAIEMLIRQYAAMKPGQFSRKIIDGEVWKAFRSQVDELISNLEIPEEKKSALRENIGDLNRVHQRDMMEAVLKDIGIAPGVDEWQAWKRRNDAAHGVATETGEELDAIRDIKLLKVLFHRMVLRIVDGADSYRDYATLEFPTRRLAEPAPPQNAG
jgi:hypothetical protein